MPLSPPEPIQRRYSGKLADPARWQAFTPRAGDIVVCTTPKSGSTWLQGILALLISGDPGVDADVSTQAPWLDISVPDVDQVMAWLEAQPQQRQVKTHTPFDGIPIWSELRYICVYRHPIDVHFSFRNHVAHMTTEVLTDVFPADIREGFRIFLDGHHQDGASLASIVDHYRSALNLGPRENLLRLHYADMRRDLPRAVAQIAAFIGVSHPADVQKALTEAATFEAMKANASRFAVAARRGFWKEDTDFFDSATSNKWVGVLSADDLARYEARLCDLLSPSERHLLEWGGCP